MSRSLRLLDFTIREHRDGSRYCEAIRGAREMRAIAFWSHWLSRGKDQPRAEGIEAAFGIPEGWFGR